MSPEWLCGLSHVLVWCCVRRWQTGYPLSCQAVRFLPLPAFPERHHWMTAEVMGCQAPAVCVRRPRAAGTAPAVWAWLLEDCGDWSFGLSYLAILSLVKCVLLYSLLTYISVSFLDFVVEWFLVFIFWLCWVLNPSPSLNVSALSLSYIYSQPWMILKLFLYVCKVVLRWIRKKRRFFLICLAIFMSKTCPGLERWSSR